MFGSKQAKDPRQQDAVAEKKAFELFIKRRAKGARFFEFWAFVLMAAIIVVCIGYGETGPWNQVHLLSRQAIEVALWSIGGYILICLAWAKVRPEAVSHYYDRRHDAWVTLLLAVLFLGMLAAGVWCIRRPLTDGRALKHTDCAVLAILLVLTYLFMVVRHGNFFLGEHRRDRQQGRKIEQAKKQEAKRTARETTMPMSHPDSFLESQFQRGD